jgi:hypothetical protein
MKLRQKSGTISKAGGKRQQARLKPAYGNRVDRFTTDV